MGNVLPSDKDIHETFDLKGSMFGRITSDEEASKNPHAVMKDQNWIKRKDKLELGPKKRELLMTQLERDVEILSKLNIMDYSLLIGIHDIQKGNTECIRDHKLHMVTVSFFIMYLFYVFVCFLLLFKAKDRSVGKKIIDETKPVSKSQHSS
jgi:1-phosphatidylinositol-4-phosphate 5-kinase